MKTAFVFLTDERGFALAEHAVAASMVTQKKTRDLIVFCVGFTPDANPRLVAEARKRGFKLEFRNIIAPEELIKGYEKKGLHAHVSSAALLKMPALDTLSKEYDRVLYLDTDILILGDLEIEKFDFDGAPVAAVYDIPRVGKLQPELGFYERCKVHGRSPHYFNSGFIVVDYAAWNSGFLEKFKQAVREHHISCDYKIECSALDECALNRVFERSWKRLPLAMNFQACAMFSQRWADVTIRHYVGKAKFLPFKAWRNDDKDTALINEARKILGLSPVGNGWPRWIRSLNVIRNSKKNKVICEAVNRVEAMYCEKM